MAKVFLFDLDMTLVDSSALAKQRQYGFWPAVYASMHLVRPFTIQGGVAPHELPARLKAAGHIVGVVTSSPGRYANEIINQFKITADTVVTYGDTTEHKPNPAPLLKALENLGIAAGPNVFYIGDDVGDVEAAYHANIMSVGVGWGYSSRYEISSAAPDIMIESPADLLHAATMELGYIGERFISGKNAHLHRGSILGCSSDVYALGRYFTTADPRHGKSALTSAVLKLKNDDAPSSVLGQGVGYAVGQLPKKPRYIVTVPPKPSQQRNRFAKLLKAAEPLLPKGVEVKLDGLTCFKEVENYKTMGPLERAEAIKGAFRSAYKWNNNDVLVIDDVYTTGGTSNEAIRVLKANGAGHIQCLVLAKDQRVFVRKTCPQCASPLKVRARKSDGHKFWGCSNYPQCRHTENF